MRKYIFLLLVLFCAGTLVYSQTSNARYVAVQKAELKSSTGFFASVVARLSLGDAVTLVRDDGRWSQVRYGNSTGYIQSSSLSTRRIIASNTSSSGTSQVALAGKGFSPATELEYKKDGLDFTMVDTMEQIAVSIDDLRTFITDGRLNAGDAKAPAANPFAAAATAGTASSNNEEFTLVDSYYLGRAVAANILASYRPYTQNQAMTQYVNRICQTLVINSFSPPAFNGFFVMILDSNDPYAFASPGGHIFISRGLIQATTSEDVLAALIAHELSHIFLQHGTSIISDMKLYNEMSDMASQMAGMAAGMAAMAGRNTTSIQQTLSFRDSITKMADALMVSGYSQPQEFEADREAMILLSKAGYNPRALLDVLRILQNFPGGQKGSLLSTHPSPADRIFRAESAARAAGYPGTGTTVQARVSRFNNRF